MKKSLLFWVVLCVLVLGMFSGCDLIGSKITIRVENKSDVLVTAYYRVSGDTEWEILVSGMLLDGVNYVDVEAGTYDVRVMDLAASGPDDIFGEIGTETDNILNYQYNWTDESAGYDYNLNIYNTFISVL
jgi:hypothetical protein